MMVMKERELFHDFNILTSDIIHYRLYSQSKSIEIEKRRKERKGKVITRIDRHGRN